jgi:hypothetical protein
MSAKKTILPRQAAQSQVAWNGFSDLGRQQMAVTTEAACAMFRGFEAMRKVQEQAAHDAAQRHAFAVQKLQQPCGAAELLAIQSELLSFDVDGATRYWQQLGAAALEMQTEVLGCCTKLANTDGILASALVLD